MAKKIIEMDIDDMIKEFKPNYRLDHRCIIKNAEINSGIKLGEFMVKLKAFLLFMSAKYN